MKGIFNDDALKVKKQLIAIRSQMSNLARFGATDVPLVSIPSIPKKKGRFQQTNDFWAEVVFPQNVDVTSCFYKIEDDAEFIWHEHDSDELILVLSGQLDVIYYDKGKEVRVTVKKNGSIYIPKNVKHKAISTGKNTAFQCVWTPAFVVGWVGDFVVE
jgi:mannose-6-phosphate isomerase-like protein (cupin superfamily)